MTTLTVSANTDYRPTSQVGITGITFTGTFFAQFNATQFGPGLIENNVAITGTTNNQQIDVFMPAGGGTFDASGWTFTNWTPYDFSAGTGDYVRLFRGAGNDTIIGTAGNDEINVSVSGGNDDLDGGLGVDRINGDSGDDILRSGAGNTRERLYDGGGGTDLLVIDRTGATASVGFGVSAVFTIQTDVSGVWSANSIERLNATGGSGNDQLYGGTLADTLIGGGGDDFIRAGGGAGVDVLDGGTGTGDWLVVDRSAATTAITFDIATQASLYTFDNGTTAINFERIEIDTGSGNDTVTGGAFSDTIRTGAGTDTLDGGAGNDNLQGGADDDIYIVDSSGDNVNDSGGANDIVRTAATSFTVWSNHTTSIERFEGTNAAGQTITMNDGTLGSITGASGSDVFQMNGGSLGAMRGGQGNDRFSVAAGSVYTAEGQQGDDTYVVGGGTLTIVEIAGEGSDTIETFQTTYTLATANVENLTGTGSSQTLTGDAQANTIRAGSGTNTLDGGGGDDTLIGASGNDTFVVDSLSDIVTEAANQGADTIRTGLASYSMAAIANVENLTGTSAGGQTLSGNGLSNTIAGAGGADDLDGGLGADTLNGGNGDDVLRSGAGNTTESTFDGGADTDLMVIDRTGATAGVTFRVSAAGTTQTDVSGSWTANNIERLNATGGSGNDTLTGGTFVDILIGGGGDDTINGGGGADDLQGGAGTGDRLVADLSAFSATTLTVASLQAGATLANGATANGFEAITLTTGSGADVLTGGGLADTFTSNAGNDDLDGGLGADTLNAGNDDDTLRSGVGNTSEGSWDGGSGTDLAIIDRSTATAAVNFSLGSTMLDVGGSWTMSNVERLNATGGSGNDTLTGGTFADALIGGGGDDVITSGGGIDTLDGGAGTNDQVFVDRSGASAGMTVSIANPSTTQTLDNGTTLVNFERLQLTTGSGADVLTGGGLVDTFTSNAGNDDLDGGLGADTLNAGNDDDTLRSGVGNTSEGFWEGGSGTDLAVIDRSTATANLSFRVSSMGSTQTDVGGNWAMNGVERLDAVGGSGNDTLIGGALSDRLFGGGGDDGVSAGVGGVDVLDGGAGTGDRLDIDRSASTAGSTITLANPSAMQTLADGTTFVNFERIFYLGGSGADVLTGGALLDTLRGGGGDDIIRSFDADNDLQGEAGIDTLVLQRTSLTGAIVLDANSAALQTIADNTIIQSFEILDVESGSGNDILTGGAFADRLIGNAGRDTLTGGLGNDTLDGGLGADTLDGGEGVDTITGGDGFDFIDAGAGNDTIDGGAGFDTIDAGAGDDTVIGGLGNDTVDGGEGADSITGGDGIDILAGGNGNDTITGGEGADALTGDAGDDTITFSFEDWTVNGGAGRDHGILDSARGWTIDMALLSFERLTSGSGADDIRTTGTHFIEVDGGAGADIIRGSADGDLLRGGLDGDLILGNGGGDAIAGEDGADRLHGGAGVDYVYGGTGVDAFVFKEFGLSNYDIVWDYQAGERIELAPDVFTGLTGGVLAASQFALAGPTASTAQVIFRVADGNGILEYDADGTGAGAAQIVAILAGTTTLSASDVFVGFTY